VRIIVKWLFAVVGKPAVWIPAMLLIATTTFFRFTDADLALSSCFFAGHGSSDNLAMAWPNRTVQPWTALYDWGIYPAWVLGRGGLATWVVSFYWGRLRTWRDPGLFLASMLVIGPGVIVNGVFNRCVEGFGGSGHLHTTRLLELSENLPVRIDIVDIAERIEPLLVALEPMIGEGLLTVTDVRIRRYLHDPKQ
jgi:uncharacterized protein